MENEFTKKMILEIREVTEDTLPDNKNFVDILKSYIERKVRQHDR